MRTIAVLAVMLSTGAFAADVPFTQDEIRAILAHGPWPAAATSDPSNRVSGRQEASEFGERLFFERRLSSGGRFSCGCGFRSAAIGPRSGNCDAAACCCCGWTTKGGTAMGTLLPIC
jgi:cytochrome c peroxidase